MATPLRARISIFWWHLVCAWCEVKAAFYSLFGDPWHPKPPNFREMRGILK